MTPKTIIKLQASNVMNIDAIVVDANGNNVTLTGKNGAGDIRMKHIENVRVFTSEINDGGVNKPCLAVIIEPYPTDEADIIQIVYDIKAAIMALNWRK